MTNILQSIGQGLRIGAGAGNESIFNQQNAQDENARNREANKNNLMAGVIIKAIQSGAMDPQKGDKLLKAAGFPGLTGLGPNYEIQQNQLSQQKQQELLRDRRASQQGLFGGQQGLFGGQVPAPQSAVNSGAGPATIFPAIDSSIDFSGNVPANVQTNTVRAEAQAIPDRQNPDLWLAYADEREAAQDIEEADRARAIAEQLAAPLRPALKTVGNNLVQVDPVVDRNTVTGFTADSIYGPEVGGDGDNQRARDIALLQETVMPDGKKMTREQAIGVLLRTKVMFDPNGWATAIDKGTGQEVNLGMSQETLKAVARSQDAQEGQGVDEGAIDYSSATGGSGAVGRSLNFIAGLFGKSDLVDAEVEQATNELELANLSTLAAFEAQIPGRPSNFHLQRIEPNLVKPSGVKGLFTGDARALRKLKDLRAEMQRESSRIQRDILDKPRNHRRAEIPAYKENKNQIDAMIAQYDKFINSMGGKKKSMREIDAEIEQTTIPGVR